MLLYPYFSISNGLYAIYGKLIPKWMFYLSFCIISCDPPQKKIGP